MMQASAETRHPTTEFYAGDMLKFYSARNVNNPARKDYKDFTVADLRHLDDGYLSMMRMTAIAKEPEFDDLIPKPFFKGNTPEQARTAFARALLRESARREFRGNNIPTAEYMLEGRYGHKAQLDPEYSKTMDTATPYTATREVDGKVVKIVASPARMYEYDVTEDVLRAGPDAPSPVRSPIRKDVAQQIYNANRDLIPFDVANTAFVTNVSDEFAYDVGYKRRYDEYRKQALPRSGGAPAVAVPKGVVSRIYDYGAYGDINPGIADAAGYAQSDIDARSNYQGTDIKYFDGYGSAPRTPARPSTQQVQKQPESTLPF